MSGLVSEERGKESGSFKCKFLLGSLGPVILGHRGVVSEVKGGLER